VATSVATPEAPRAASYTKHWDTAPSVAAEINDVVVVAEDPVGEPVVAYELPEVLDRVQLRRARR
jgi:hypothetical protein